MTSCTIKTEEESASETESCTESDAVTFVCCLCKAKTFRQKSQLTAHLLTHHESGKKEDPSEGENKPFICQICSKAFTWLTYLKQHLLYRHSKRQTTAQQPSAPRGHAIGRSKTKKCSRVACEFCDKTFAKREYLLPHHRRAHPEELSACDDCGKKFASDWLKKHSCVFGPPFVCGTCDKEFASKTSLHGHLRTHAKSEECDEDLACEQCDMHFDSELKLGNHKWIHTADRPFTCDTCGKGFVAEGHLKRHAKMHEGKGLMAENTEKPFTCEKCDRSFVQKSHLVMHIRFNHPN